MEEPGSQFVTYIVASPEQVWAALTSGDLTRQYFFGRKVESDWQAGSPWKLLMADGQVDSGGKVLESDPPRRLAVSWRVEWMDEMRSLPEAKVLYEIESLGGVTRLTVSEFQHPTLEEKYKQGGRKGWPIILSGLKTLLETGRPMPEFTLPAAPAK